MNNKSNKRGGCYWVDGKPYVSVTNILKVIDKPAIRYWFGKEVYWAMVKDPSLDEKAALSAPYQTSGKAKNRGTTVHSIVESFKNTRKYIDTVPESFKGYADAFYAWTKDNHITIIEHERTVISHKYSYAGTLDLLVKMNGNKLPIIVDVKTGKDIYAESHLQNSAYYNALIEENINPEGIATLLLMENGKYKYEQGEISFDVFLHAKALYEWQNKEQLLKLGYYQERII